MCSVQSHPDQHLLQHFEVTSEEGRIRTTTWHPLTTRRKPIDSTVSTYFGLRIRRSANMKSKLVSSCRKTSSPESLQLWSSSTAVDWYVDSEAVSLSSQELTSYTLTTNCRLQETVSFPAGSAHISSPSSTATTQS